MLTTKRLNSYTAQALCEAIAKGWTVKEAACYKGMSIKAVQRAVSRAGIVLAYGGNGPKPTPAKLKQTQDFFTRNHNNQTTQNQ